MNETSNGKVVTIKKLFSRETGVSIEINATPSQIWDLITNASDYPKWNSTIISITGTISLGNQIILKSTLDPNRSFKLTVKEFEKDKRLLWGDAMGKRVFTIDSKGKGVTFKMVEKIGGPLFPLFSKMIPSFDSSFEKFANDLKKAAEKTS